MVVQRFSAISSYVAGFLMSEMAGSGAERLSKSTHTAEGIVAVPSTASLFQDLQGKKGHQMT